MSVYAFGVDLVYGGRKEAVWKEDYDRVVTQNLAMRDFLLARAKECEACGGTGCVTVMRYAGAPLYFEGEKVERVEDCGECEPIRELLA